MAWGFSGSRQEMKVSGNSNRCYWVCFQVCFQVRAASLPASHQWAQLLLRGQLGHGHSWNEQQPPLTVQLEQAVGQHPDPPPPQTDLGIFITEP